jgi:predicted acylesterase/phospholipase RssA
MKSALLTGGGDYIAFTIGRLKATPVEYDIIVGTSAGALIAPLVAIGRIDKAESIIDSITPERIFNVNPFNEKGYIKPLHAIKRITLGKRTIGENENLPKLLKEVYTEDDHSKLKKGKAQVYVTVCNINRADYPGEIVCLNENSYESAINYMWASASVPVVCSIVKIGLHEYCDGGTTLNVPVDFLVSKGVDTIDVYLHDTKPQNELKRPVENIFHFIGRILKWQRQKVQYDQLISLNNDIGIRCYWLPYKPEKHCLTFDKDVMAKYKQDGFNQMFK